MSVYDNFVIAGEPDSRFRCASGHPVIDMQSKDFDCAMLTYRVFGGKIYVSKRDGLFSDDLPASSVHVQDGNLIVTERTIHTQVRTSVSARVYTHCEMCEPVMTVSSRGSWHGDICEEWRPWCEFQILYRDGEITEVNPLRVETREAVRKGLRERGLKDLLDDDPLVIVHRQRKAKDS